MYAERSSDRQTQDAFRRANERLLHAVRDHVDGERPIPFLCECLDPSCRSTVTLTVEEFHNLRENPNRFAIVTGHPRMDGEDVLATEGDVSIVEKDA